MSIHHTNLIHRDRHLRNEPLDTVYSTVSPHTVFRWQPIKDMYHDVEDTSKVFGVFAPCLFTRAILLCLVADKVHVQERTPHATTKVPIVTPVPLQPEHDGDCGLFISTSVHIISCKLRLGLSGSSSSKCKAYWYCF